MRPEDIGPQIRAARLAHGQSLRQLAAELGVSASLLSQVENGKVQPSVATLYALVNHLGISLDNMLGGGETEAPTAGQGPDPQIDVPLLAMDHVAPPAPIVQRRDQNPTLDMDNGVRWERLSGSSTEGPEILLVTYQAGASSSIDGKLMRHNGHEYAYLLEGTLTLQVGFDVFEVHAGDSFNFDSTRPHMYINRGDTAARGLWYISGRHSSLPPAFFAEAAFKSSTPEDLWTAQQEH